MIEWLIMYRWVLVVSILLLIALGIFLIFPRLKSMIHADTDLDKALITYNAFMTDHGLLDEIPGVHIVICKDNKILYLMSGDVLVERWRVALGSNPVGPKSESRDGKTPTGEYTICARDPSTNHMFLFVNYPNRSDADRALGQGLISERDHQEIYRAVNEGRIPPADTSLGGGLGIHGGGVTHDWTDGSIAVSDDVIEILWNACEDGTSITILETFNEWDLSPRMPSGVE